MAERNEEAESVVESLMEKIHAAGDSSSSSSDEGEERKAKEKEKSVSAAVKEMQSKVFRMFGREKPVHSVLGGGKPADLILWRNKKISASVLGAATAVWLLFEVLEYHLLTLISHCFIFSLAGLFVWSRICVFLHRAPPRIPELKIPEDLTVNVARSLRYEVNRAFTVLREIGSGKDLKKFLVIIAGLWFLSVLGSSCNFLTLCYIVFVLLYTVPVLYEKHEDKVDQFAEKASIEGQKYFAIFNEKCLSKIPRGPLKYKKLN